MSILLKMSALLGLSFITFVGLRLSLGSIANFISLFAAVIILLIGAVIMIFKAKNHNNDFTVPRPGQLSGFRRAYNNYDFLGGDISFTEDLNSTASAHPAQTMDRISALLMFTNRNATFNEQQICLIASGWAQLMLESCKDGHYPGYGSRYKDSNLRHEILIGAVYNGMYRALQENYSPNYDVDCLLAETSLHRYIMLIFDTFIDDPDNFGRIGANCTATLQKLRKFFKSHG